MSESSRGTCIQRKPGQPPSHAKVKNGSLTGADIKNNSLTGDDINESTLGQVPSANTANTANSANSVAANGVNTAALQDNAVTSAKIADDAVTGPKIAADAVGASELKGIYSAVSGGTAGLPIRS